MGKLIDGKWTQGSVIQSDSKGAYDRQPRTFLETLSKDHPRFQPESNRYHLYVGYACPWATRCLIYRSLKSLENHISVSVVHPDMLSQGWQFDPSFPGSTKDDLYGKKNLYEIYLKADAKITTSVTVPVLWDKKHETIVNNESSQIIRIFNSAFNELTQNNRDFYPKALQSTIDQWNEKIYHTVNNGVYRCGFSKTQEAYDEASSDLFKTLNELNEHLETNTYLCGDDLTEADLRLIPTLLRFDLVYVTHFKCNWKRIQDYPHLLRYTQNLYSMPEIRSNHHGDHIKRHYYYSHESINPHRIIPKGPADLGFDS